MSPRLRLISVLSLALTVLLYGQSARAQQAVVTSPTGGTTSGGNASSTIVATGVFQLLFSAASPLAGGASTRRGCTIQNNGTHNMYVTEGLGIAASTLTNSAILAPGVPYYCTNGGVVLTGEIDITGTIGDAFYAAQE